MGVPGPSERKVPDPDSPGFAGNTLWESLRSPRTPLLARSPARLPHWSWRRNRAGPGFPSISSIRISGRSSKTVAPPSPMAFGRGIGAGQSARDGTPSFREINLRIEARLNIRAGSSRARRGTRLNRRFRETGPSEEGTGELAVDQLASPRSRTSCLARGKTKLPPGRGAPALVKSCERYRSSHQGSITPNANIRHPHPVGDRLSLEV